MSTPIEIEIHIDVDWNRRRGIELDRERTKFEVEQQTSTSWLEEHAETIEYRDILAGQVADRLHDLGEKAATERPDHVVAIIGSKPDEPVAEHRWTYMATGIEAYREEWGVEPERVGERPGTRCRTSGGSRE